MTPGKIAIALMPDEPGHQNAALTLAGRLRARGHAVTFVIAADDEEAFEHQGFEYQVVLRRSYPRGSVAKAKELQARRDLASGYELFRAQLGRMRQIRGEIAEDGERLKSEGFDLCMVDPGAPIAFYLALAVGAPMMALNTTLPFTFRFFPPLQTRYMPSKTGALPLGARWARMQQSYGLGPAVGWALMKWLGLHPSDLIRTFAPDKPWRTHEEVVESIDNLVLCPVDFDFPFPDQAPPRFHYVDAMIDDARREEPFASPALEGRPLVYAAMGSQAWLLGNRLEPLYRTLIDATRDQPWHLLIAVGAYLDAGRLDPLPPNVTVVVRTPQLAVLRHASLFLTHGGLNSVKESISAGVPMIVMPMGRDQPGNGARVEFHGLGRAVRPTDLTPDRARAMIAEVLTEPSYRERTAAMAIRFREEAAKQSAVALVESMLGARRSERPELVGELKR